MKLQDYKKKTKKTFWQVAEETGISRSTLQRMCLGEEKCLKLAKAKILVEWSNGEIGFEDMM